MKETEIWTICYTEINSVISIVDPNFTKMRDLTEFENRQIVESRTAGASVNKTPELLSFFVHSRRSSEMKPKNNL